METVVVEVEGFTGRIANIQYEARNQASSNTAPKAVRDPIPSHRVACLRVCQEP